MPQINYNILYYLKLEISNCLLLKIKSTHNTQCVCTKNRYIYQHRVITIKFPSIEAFYKITGFVLKM